VEAPLLGEPLPVELMNTVWADRDGVHDALAEPEGVAAWLATMAHRLAPLGVGPGGDVPPPLAADFRQLRDALRRLAAAVTHDGRPAAVPHDGRPAAVPHDGRPAAVMSPTGDDVAVVNRACASAPVWSQLGWVDGAEPVRVAASAHPPGEVALAVVAEQGVWLFAGPDRPSIRACPGPGCVLYFVRDHPRREWCSAACGNRARVARHYQRHQRTRPRGE
jgi:predicted RNA-binding Zn ribbon-like protein